MELPIPKQIKQARKDAGLTQSQAAILIYSELRTWQHWEKGDRAMHPAFFELFLIKTNFKASGYNAKLTGRGTQELSNEYRL